MFNNIKIPKDALFLLPGLKLKRWFFLLIIGVLFAAFGIILIFKLAPLTFLIKAIRKLVLQYPHLLETGGFLFVIAGAIIFVKSFKKANFSLMDIGEEREENAVMENVYRRMKLNRGPKIVAIGGGTGLSTILKGLKRITNNITAVVTVGDDGGSSGRLREEMGIIPPGDIRNCIAALADDDDIVTKLFQYRFKTGEGLEGHSFGNLFITAMSAVCGDVVNAIKESSKVLLIRGRVLPSTVADMRLIATMEDGSVVKGESNIPEALKKITVLSCEPNICIPNKEVIDAIKDADLIVMGPGSLYTSIIPNFLVQDIAVAVENAKAKKLYICNVMTQPGETDNYSVSDHVKAILKHAKLYGVQDTSNFLDAVLVNSSMPENLAKKYEDKESYPVELDSGEIKKMGLALVQHKLIEDNPEGLVRHNPSRLARAVYYWYRKSKRDGKKNENNIKKA